MSGLLIHFFNVKALRAIREKLSFLYYLALKTLTLEGVSKILFHIDTTRGFPKEIIFVISGDKCSHITDYEYLPKC
jgi:hypothetical protein